MRTGPIVLDARTASSHFPGIGRTVIGLARALAVCPAAPRMMLIHGADPDLRLPLARWPGVACRSTPFGIRQQWEVRACVRRAGAAVYHSPYYLMPAAPGAPSIVTCNDLIPLTAPGLFGPPARLAYRLAHALAFRAASAIVVPSASTREDVARLFPRHARKLEVVPHGWEFAEATDEDRSARLRRQLGVPDAYVLAVGSNKPHKNLRVLAQAWERTLSRRRDGGRKAALVLAGPRDGRFDEGGPSGERLRAGGHLLSLGPVSDEALAALYGGATLFICASSAEGFGLPAVEAMGLGAPVICSRIPALVEVTGGAAALFDPADADALARLLEHLLEAPDERESMRQTGFARAAAFTWARAADTMAGLYERVAGGRA
jgi:glycosyltransferase involved in cell wall biosynthesis